MASPMSQSDDLLIATFAIGSAGNGMDWRKPSLLPLHAIAVYDCGNVALMLPMKRPDETVRVIPLRRASAQLRDQFYSIAGLHEMALEV